MDPCGRLDVSRRRPGDAVHLTRSLLVEQQPFQGKEMLSRDVEVNQAVQPVESGLQIRNLRDGLGLENRRAGKQCESTRLPICANHHGARGISREITQDGLQSQVNRPRVDADRARCGRGKLPVDHNLLAYPQRCRSQ